MPYMIIRIFDPYQNQPGNLACDKLSHIDRCHFDTDQGPKRLNG